MNRAEGDVPEGILSVYNSGVKEIMPDSDGRRRYEKVGL
jgi:hypothetical protein